MTIFCESILCCSKSRVKSLCKTIEAFVDRYVADMDCLLLE